MEDLEELREIVDGLTYCAVMPHAPEWYLNPVFKTILGAEDGVFEPLCDDHPLFFADHFLRVLKDDEPPSLDFFRLLSSPARGDKPIWGVYSLVLEKVGFPAMLYVGSGTDVILGVYSRLKAYERVDGSNIPQPVRQAIKDGYTISYSGLLCWHNMPSAAHVPRA